jgi:hypothetical protein
MSTTGLEVFDRTIHKTNIWLKDLMEMLDCEDRHEASNSHQRRTYSRSARRRRCFSNCTWMTPVGPRTSPNALPFS